MLGDAVLNEALRDLLETLGATDQDVLRDTPGRWLRALREMTSGEGVDPASVLKTFPHEGTGVVSCRDIAFASVCEHHLLPFHGTADVSYSPRGGILGLSKVARVVDLLSRRLQVQERLAEQVAGAIWEMAPRPGGVLVRLRATHGCIRCRGARASTMIVEATAARGDAINLSGPSAHIPG